MSTEEAVRDSQMLLEQIAREPQVMLAALDPGELDRMMDGLSGLSELASKVQAEADLLYVAEAVHRLVEEMPALTALLLASDAVAQATQKWRTTRKMTARYDEAAYQKSLHAQRRAAQIRNRVVECRQNLEEALRETTRRRSGDDR